MTGDVNEFDVSVVIPTYNEEDSIESCLDSLLRADNRYGQTEILVVDGFSEDATRALVEPYVNEREFVELLDNPDRTTPHAMNVGMQHATGSIIVFISGHSSVSEAFFERIHTAFERAPDAGVVGGRMVPKPDSYFETAVAGALISRLGSSSTRFQPVEGYVETVNFGAYRREVVETVGPMETGLPRAQDYEYNRRVRQHGFKIYQYPDLEVSYHPRSTPGSLARQYFGSGYWKTNVFREFDEYPAPPLLCASAAIVIGLLGSPLLLIAGVPLYVLVLLATAGHSLRSGRIDRLGFLHLPGVVVALVIMHVSFGLGLLVGSLSAPKSSENA